MVVVKGLSTALNTKVVGSGKTTLLLAHGYGGDQSVWDEILPDLSLLYTVVLFDWSFSGSVDNSAPAFSGGAKKSSSYEDFSEELIALADEMRLRDVVYVGHSMAGMIGCIASIRRPEIFRRLVLVAASPRYLNAEDYKGGFDRTAIDSLLTNIEFNFHEWAACFPFLVFDKNNPAATEKFGKMLRKMGPETGLSLARTVFLSDHRDVLDKVEVPCFLIQCSDDIIVPMAAAEYMEKKMKAKAGAEMEVIQAEGHFPQLTAAKAFVEVVDRVLGFDCTLAVN